MPLLPETVVDEESDYASSDDSDFAPDAIPIAAASDDSSESESDNEEDDTSTNANKVKGKSKKRKRGAKAKQGTEAEDLGFENSGDEAVVGKALKKQKKIRKRRGKGEQEVEEEESEGEGGGLFVRTRRMAALAVEEEKRPLANTDAATVDVDALWTSMMRGPTEPTPSTTDPNASPRSPQNTRMPAPSETKSTINTEESMIMINRTYNFAGKVHTESKLVPRSSAEANLYLSSLPTPSADNPAPSPKSTDKPLRARPKARRSIFEPVIETLPQRSDLHFGAAAIARLGLETSRDKGKKLNTVEKSKMDWAGYVDQEGLREELEGAGKAKKAMLGQADFLARVEGKKEEETRRARLQAAGVAG